MPLADFKPTAAEVGALLRARTKDVNGNEAGTFNNDTRPTGAQVDSLAADAAGEVASVMGTEDPCPDMEPESQATVYAKARSAARVYTAMLVELSYFPEQVETGRSPYDRLEKLWTSRSSSLAEFVSEQCGGGSDAGGSGGIPLAQASFPDQRVIGRETSW